MRSKSTATASPTSTTWLKLIWAVPAALALLVSVVVAAQWLSRLPGVQSFTASYPGESHPAGQVPVGFPAWLGWQHFLNTLIILLLIRSGWMVRTTLRPGVYWTRNNDGLIRTPNPPRKISLDLWFHLTLSALFAINGAAFYILLFATGQWKRLVPASWDVFPNAISTALQYMSLNWPTEHSWINYNALQQLAYFGTVFIAAPLAMATGVRMSAAWPVGAKRLNRFYPIEVARAIHFPVMVYFVVFITVHVTLVLATGARRNLNHMYAMRDDTSWIGFGVFAGSLVVITVVWIAAQPLFLRPVAALSGRLSRR